MSYARWLMTQYLQRRLAPDEHVDHINDNSLDDRIENYQLLTPAENNSKSNLGRPSPLKGIEKGWTHGTTYGWIKKKCRCVECDKARLKFYKERNAKRKAENKSKLTESNRQPRSAYKGPCPHGSFRSYKRGCRCGECRAANTLWSKVKKEKGESLPTTEKIV